MDRNIKTTWCFATLFMIGISSALSAAKNDKSCHPTPPVPCYPADCEPCYCLGPSKFGVNAPVRPKTCNGDLFITVAGFYWNTHQDGMEYAIENEVTQPVTIPTDIGELNNLIDAKYKNPHFDWDFGFKVGLGYNTICDGWDISILWTWYRGKANDHIETESDDNKSLLPLWSAYAPVQGGVLYATDIETHWKLQMNLIDFELGREFWTSKYLSLRPHIGFRIAFLNQNYLIHHRGGSYSSNNFQNQISVNNEVDLENNFKGIGLRGGLDTVWNIGCGFGLYGNFALSILNGKFSIDQNERNREATTPFSKSKVLEFENSFHASRGAIDLILGIQWTTLFCECKYGLTAMLGWEQHLFFDQNQLWRIVRIGDVPPISNGLLQQPFNNTGENVYDERRGNLDTQGWTLTFRFEF